MFHLLVTLILSAIVFWFVWSVLGGRSVFRDLVVDEEAELERDLQDEEDRLAALPTEGASEEIDVLRAYSTERIIRLRRQLARARGESVPSPIPPSMNDSVH